jgi:hypothetical protein
MRAVSLGSPSTALSAVSRFSVSKLLSKAIVRNPCPVMSSFEKPKRLNAAFTVPSSP